MEVLLLTDITGVGRKNDVLVVRNGFALNHLLPERRALVMTPNVRKRYAEQIKERALMREREREIQTSLSSALAGKVLHVVAKASKAGKLYAAVSEEMVAAALKAEHAIDVPADSIELASAVKTVGKHQATVAIGAQSQQITIEVKAEGGAEK